ncbi:hypothetical protein CYMTET_29813 [Cymbomonas tetramitiformis]|uniref:Uncharacterized protein n=1 Tax=Cymbomonas tetramitiformis TaxID=36881 RepID=A0AAE0KUJ2_9CHLO|nr:hypothetical protein CYMTET_29813 [Cymbomonas tetramitiformis]
MGDTLPPSFVPPRPLLTSTDEESFAGEVELNEAGTVYFIVLPAGSVAPTWEEVYQGGGEAVARGSFLVNASLAGCTGLSCVFVAEGLASSQQYDAYFVAQDTEAPRPNNSTEIASILGILTQDVSPPSFLEGFPNASDFGDTMFDLNVMLNEEGQVFYIVVRACAGEPTIADVVNGTMPTGCSCCAGVCTGDDCVDQACLIDCEVVTGGNLTVVNRSLPVVQPVTGLLSSQEFENATGSCFNGSVINLDSKYRVYLVAEDDESPPNRQVKPFKVAPFDVEAARPANLTIDMNDGEAPRFLDYTPYIDPNHIREDSFMLEVKADSEALIVYSVSSVSHNAQSLLDGSGDLTDSQVANGRNYTEGNVPVRIVVEGCPQLGDVLPNTAYVVSVVLRDRTGNKISEVETRGITTLRPSSR